MSPRPRSARKRGWPAGLYERDGYFSWRHPISRKEFGLGRDKNAAMAQAIEANLHLQGATAQRRLVDRLVGGDDRTVGAWARKFEKQLDARELAANTRKSYRSLLKKLVALLGEETVLDRITVMHVAEAFDSEKDSGRARSAQALRSFATDFFRAAVAAGWIASNPVLVTEKVKVKVKRARLTWEVCERVLQNTTVVWLRNAIRLALVTGQRREEISAAQFRDFHDGGWWCVQRKTGNRVFIPDELRLGVLDASLADVVRQCRATGVLSKHLVHQTERYGNSKPGARIFVDTVSKRFSDEITALGIDWGDRDPPTFHELRSLSKRLYEAQGGVNTKDLLGHLDDDSAALYGNARGAEWIRVTLG